jgi:hypothetical protein
VVINNVIVLPMYVIMYQSIILEALEKLFLDQFILVCAKLQMIPITKMLQSFFLLLHDARPFKPNQNTPPSALNTRYWQVSRPEGITLFKGLVWFYTSKLYLLEIGLWIIFFFREKGFHQFH